MRNFLVCAIVLMLTFMFCRAEALAFGSSNLGYMGYPSHNCVKPYPPYSNDKYAMDRFLREIEAYSNCMEEYVRAAQNDMSSIRSRIDAAVQEHNWFLQSLR